MRIWTVSQVEEWSGEVDIRCYENIDVKYLCIYMDITGMLSPKEDR